MQNPSGSQGYDPDSASLYLLQILKFNRSTAASVYFHAGVYFEASVHFNANGLALIKLVYL